MPTVSIQNNRLGYGLEVSMGMQPVEFSYESPQWGGLLEALAWHPGHMPSRLPRALVFGIEHAGARERIECLLASGYEVICASGTEMLPLWFEQLAVDADFDARLIDVSLVVDDEQARQNLIKLYRPLRIHDFSASALPAVEFLSHAGQSVLPAYRS